MFLSLPLPHSANRIGVPRLTHRPSRGAIAAGCAVACHALILALVIRLAVDPIAPAPEARGIAVIFTQAAQPMAQAGSQQIGQAALRSASLRSTIGAPLAVPPPLHLTAVRAAAPPHPPRPATATRAPAEPMPGVGARLPARPPAMPATQPAPAIGQSMARLEASIDDAVRRQAAMPPAAIRQRREGRAQLRFSYVDGAVDDIAVAQSSQSRLLDDAAVQAVRAAHYPPPPAALRGRRLALQLWIDFRLASSPG